MGMWWWWWWLFTAHELNVIPRVAICTHTEVPQRQGGVIAGINACPESTAEWSQGPVCMWQSLELHYSFKGWVDRQ